MSNVDQLSNFLKRITSDCNLTATHVSMCTALYGAWASNHFNNPFNISRKRLMLAAKIKSKTTYHKIIADLVQLKYLQYNPSYHPLKGSQVYIM